MTLHVHSNPAAILALEPEGLALAQSPAAGALRVAMLNLMPDKRQAERQMARLLARSGLDVSLTLFLAPGHRPRNEDPRYLSRHYLPWRQVRNGRHDALVVTGTPLETIAFRDVRYWDGLGEVLDWSRAAVASSWFSCWGAMAALFHDHGVPKRTLPVKRFGLFEHRVLAPDSPLTRGLGERYTVPVSRNAEVPLLWLACRRGLDVLAASPAAGAGLVAERGLRRVYMLDHPEYEADTLLAEYRRDRAAGLATPPPRGIDPDRPPPLPRWQEVGVQLFTNWLQVVAQARPARAA